MIKTHKEDGYIYEKEYDDNKNLIRYDITSEDDDYKFSSTMVYNDKNQMIEYTDTDGKIIKREYDSVGRVEWSRNEKGEAMHYMYNSPTSRELSRMELVSNKRVLVYQSNEVPEARLHRIVVETDDIETLKEIKKAIGMYANVKIQ